MCLKAFLFKQKHTHKHIQSKMIRRFMVCFLSFLFMVLCSFLFMLAPFVSSLSEFCLCGCLIEVNMFVLLALCVYVLSLFLSICSSVSLFSLPTLSWAHVCLAYYLLSVLIAYCFILIALCLMEYGWFAFPCLIMFN